MTSTPTVSQVLKRAGQPTDAPRSEGPPEKLEGASGRIRAFVALALPPVWIEGLARLLEQLRARPGGGSVRWVRADQHHLTLHFLGNVNPAEVTRLSAELIAACAGVRSFDLHLAELGGFPDLRTPRVIWIGLRGATDRLAELQQRVEVATRHFGDHREDRVFHPHLTLGRMSTRSRDAGRRGGSMTEVPLPRSGPWTVQDVRLVQSELRPQGSRYTVLTRVPLVEQGAPG